MDTAILITLILGFVGLLLRSYFEEKGKNQAAKEDIGTITREIEEIKKVFSDSLEYHKATLQNALDLLCEKRNIYNNLIRSMSVFISNRSDTENLKENFLHDYATLWLWAPDHVIRDVSEFIDMNRKIAAGIPVSQDELRSQYTKCVLEMRKNCAFEDTKLEGNDYQVVSFL